MGAWIIGRRLRRRRPHPTNDEQFLPSTTAAQVPKNARATPRYLLKIQTEVDAMQQLGGSLDAVFLQVRWCQLLMQGAACGRWCLPFKWGAP